ncbi:MAG: hypothetical protein FWB86_10255 [Treponema sp.]|nr:hypothetical protein [Treponema sp.]
MNFEISAVSISVADRIARNMFTASQKIVEADDLIIEHEFYNDMRVIYEQ